MTIPKNAGLSHLADVANESIGVKHYPVKRKGERRRLVPNWDAIRYLEDESWTDTEISEELTAGEAVFDDDAVYLGTEFKIQRALGYFSARQRGMYPWPMFQVFASFKISMVPYSPCPDCDDFSRTSKCEVHHDRDGVAGLKMGDERRRGSLITASAMDRLRNLPDGTLTIEVNGETVQGIQSFTINIDEGDAHDR